MTRDEIAAIWRTAYTAGWDACAEQTPFNDEIPATVVLPAPAVPTEEP